MLLIEAGGHAPSRLVPVERIELPTFGLQNRCSTAELNRRIETRRDHACEAGNRWRTSRPSNSRVAGREPRFLATIPWPLGPSLAGQVRLCLPVLQAIF